MTDENSLKSYFLEATKTLRTLNRNAGIVDARLLIQFGLKLTPEEFLTQQNKTLSAKEKQIIDNLIQRRGRGEPVSKIIGIKEFWSSEFKTTTDVLDPRPDSEVLIETTLELLPDQDTPYSFLDMGTGSGCLVITLLKQYPISTATAIDISQKALDIALENATTHGVSKRLMLQKGSWWEALNSLSEQKTYDIIISNPPYIPSAEIVSLSREVRDYDPHRALDGGTDGLDDYREIFSEVDEYLSKNGYCVVEIGYTQKDDVINLIKSNPQLIYVDYRKDIEGRPRCVIAQKI